MTHLTCCFHSYDSPDLLFDSHVYSDNLLHSEDSSALFFDSHAYSDMFILSEDSSDLFFVVGVVAPLIISCFAIFFCAINSLWKTRKNLARLSCAEQPAVPDYTEFTIDITTKVKWCETYGKRHLLKAIWWVIW